MHSRPEKDDNTNHLKGEPPKPVYARERRTEERDRKNKAETDPLESCVRMREQNKAAIAEAPTKM